MITPVKVLTSTNIENDGIAEASNSPAILALEVFKDSAFILDDRKTFVCYSNRKTYKQIN